MNPIDILVVVDLVLVIEPKVQHQQIDYDDDDEAVGSLEASLAVKSRIGTMNR